MPGELTGAVDHSLEELNDRAVPGRERHRIGRWVLRADRGATDRANSVWPSGHPGQSLMAAVDDVEAWYRARGLRPCFMLYGGADTGLTAELDGRGYVAHSHTLVLTGALETVMAELDAAGDVSPWTVTVEAGPSTASRALMGDDDRMAEVTATALDQRFVTVLDKTGELLGGGFTTIDGPWCGLFAMKTVPSARRRGVASVVMIELARAATAIGATQAWLQVAVDNSAAVALYRRAGFGDSNHYHYRAAPERERSR